MSNLKVKKGDTVLVISGKDKGKIAKINAAYPKKNKVIVEGVNMLTHFNKPRSAQDQNAGIKKSEGAIQVSNVMIVCSSCKKATRVAYKIVGDSKIRVCKKCGASLEQTAAAKKEIKKAAKKAEKAEEVKTEAVADTKVEAKAEVIAKPATKAKKAAAVKTEKAPKAEKAVKTAKKSKEENK